MKHNEIFQNRLPHATIFLLSLFPNKNIPCRFLLKLSHKRYSMKVVVSKIKII